MDIEHEPEKKKQLKRVLSITSLSDDEEQSTEVKKEAEVCFLGYQI